MKKYILTIATIIFFANIISAQDNSSDLRNSLQFGLKAGANFSNVYDSKNQEFNADFKVGFAAGAFLAIPIGKFIGFQPEILFSQKGYKASGTFLTIPYEFSHTTNYIDVPLLFSLKPSTFITLLAGPDYSFLVSQKDVFTGGGFTSTQEKEFKNDKSVLCFVAGIDITMDRFVLGARAGWDLQNNNGDGTSTNPRYKNVWYQATLGFRF
ncbi:MAG TPA: porin family protein [Bacteroidales bacterium]